MDGWKEKTSPFHAGEKAIQERYGVRDEMEAFARRVVRPHLTDQHIDFFEQLPFVLVGSVDREGEVWASMITGEPGFIKAKSAKELFVAARPLCTDPLLNNLLVGAPLGFLGIDFATRRRNRVNGRVKATEENSFTVGVDQSFGNCPQYIQTRTTALRSDEFSRRLVECTAFEDLDDEAQAMIEQSDTFFVASYADQREDELIEGVDVSHRGGRPGFVKVEGNTLTIPDFSGNFHFNTLGNLIKNSRAGLLFADFKTGDLITLTGRAEVIWDGPLVEAFEGAERIWTFTVKRGRRLRKALPFRLDFGEFSPNTLATGDWAGAAAAHELIDQKDNWRKCRVTKVVDESQSIRSFTLKPLDENGMPAFLAGQYLTVRVTPEGETKDILRTYTVSSAPHEDAFRISVKREGSSDSQVPPGIVSNHLHDKVGVGDLIEIKNPRGDFFIDASEVRPAVLLAGGVGVTPMISMLRHVLDEKLQQRPVRDITLIHAAQSRAERAFFEEVSTICRSSDGAIKYMSLLDNPDPQDQLGRDYHGTGYITADFLRETLSLDDYDFFLCGPPPFMQAVYDALRSLGVRDTRVRAEAFGPASLVRMPDAGAPAPAVIEATAEEALIRFTKSGFEQRWTTNDGTLLEFAEDHGLAPLFGCRNGLCGTCSVRLLAGEVVYDAPPSGAIETGQVLLCCARPKAGSTEIELDL